MTKPTQVTKVRNREAVPRPARKNSALTTVPSWTGEAFLGLFLLVLALIAYRPALDGQSLWDDDMHLTAPGLRSVEGLARIWTHPGVTQQYYPLTHSVFWLGYRLWGDSMTSYHLLTVFLHVFSALLLVWIMRFLGIPLAWLIGMVFALHPVQVESAAWITEIKNTLSGVFYLSAALMYLMFDKVKKPKWYVGALAFFILGLLSKSVIATLPVSLLAVIWWKRGTGAWKRDLLLLAPFFAIGIASGLFTAWIEHAYIGAQGSDFNFTFMERCLIAGRTFWFYLGKSIWPVDLVFFYPRWTVSQAVWWQYLFPLGVAGLFVLCWLLRRRWPGLLASMVFYAATLFPVMGFFNVYPFRFSFVADHFQYLAIIAPLALGAAGMGRLLESLKKSRSRLAKGALYIMITPALVLSTWNQSRMYTDEETLYRTTIAKNSSCSMAHNNLGILLAATGRQQEAADNYRKAIKLNPAFFEVFNNIGILLWNAGRADEAIAFYRKSLSINPNYAEGNYNLGSALTYAGHTQEAITLFQKAILVKPGYIEARNNLGNALLQAGRHEEAIAQYLAVLKTDPAMERTHNNLAVAFEKTGRTNDAVAEYQKALEINPALHGSHNSLAQLLEKTGRIDEALIHYRRALELAPDNVPLLYTFVSALKRAKRFDEAIPLLRHALELAGAAGQKEAVLEIGEDLYRCEAAGGRLDSSKQ